MANALGLSVGATQLVATSDDPRDVPVVRSPVLTLHDGFPVSVGAAAGGLSLVGFVDRVGDPVGIVAADGSVHHADWALSEALRIMVADVAGVTTFSFPPAIAASMPAHWAPPTVAALRSAIDKVPGLAPGGKPMTLVSDTTAALTSLADGPGTPGRGVVIVCDLGGSGTNITLTDAADGFRQLGPTVRYPDFSGRHIDQELLAQVLAGLNHDPEGTVALGALAAMRDRCRLAKERLSTETVAVVPVELPGVSTEVRISRGELEERIRGPLSGLIAAVRGVVERNGIHPANVTGIAAVGGGANIPLVTQQLSDQLRSPVITLAQPQLAAARGAALLAARREQSATTAVPSAGRIGEATQLSPVVADDSKGDAGEPTQLSPVVVSVPESRVADATELSPVVAESAAGLGLAWSQEDSSPELLPLNDDYGQEYLDATEAVRPQPKSPDAPRGARGAEYAGAEEIAWYRRSWVVFIGVALIVAVVLTTLIVALDGGSSAPGLPATSSTVKPVPTASTHKPSKKTEHPSS